MAVISSFGEVSGLPVIDRDTCTHCGACAETCPTGVLTMDGDTVLVDVAVTFGCIACGQCMMACPTGSVAVTGRRVSPDQLVELPGPARRASADQLEALFLARRSVRRFQPDDVPGDVVDRVVAAAATAPMGIPPWEVGVVVFRGRPKVRELARDVAHTYAGLLKWMDNAAVMGLLRVFAKKATYDQFRSFILPLGRDVVAARRAGQDKVLYDAPAALLFHTSPYADGADAFIACTYAMLAAESLGLGSTMIGCAAPPLARRRDLLRKYGVPERSKPAIVLILGYPATTYVRGIRRPFLAVKDF